MRRLLTWVVLSVVAAPLAARADGSVSLSASAGVAKPFGDVANGVKLGDDVDWAFPLEAQAGVRVARQVTLGAYLRYAPVAVPSGCPGCSSSDLGVGARAEYRLDEKAEGGGWLGAFAGYGQLKSGVRLTDGSTRTIRYGGPEGGIAGGVDFELGPVTVGPWLQLGLGEYTRQSGAGISSTIASEGVHGFFGGGVRMGLLL